MCLCVCVYTVYCLHVAEVHETRFLGEHLSSLYPRSCVALIVFMIMFKKYHKLGHSCPDLILLDFFRGRGGESILALCPCFSCIDYSSQKLTSPEPDEGLS